jgi:uncharacterized protein
MRLFDCHSHWSTRRGYVFQTDAELKNQERVWGTKATFQTEDEMIATFRKNNVRVMMDLATTVLYPMDMDKIREDHDYTFEVQRKNPDAIFGHWLSFDPRLGKKAIKEYERAVAAKAGFIGFGIIGQAAHGHPASDPIWDPFYKTSIDANIPVLIHSGLTGIGQGLPGGRGIILDHGHPRQDEMIAILLHKGNVHYELHGWSPKTYSPALKREIGGRLQDRIMFGCDYPVLKYEMMVERWRGLGYSEEVLEKVFYRNAEAYFPSAKMP